MREYVRQLDTIIIEDRLPDYSLESITDALAI